MLELCETIWQKPERLNPAEWSERHRYLSSEAAANPGKYSFDRTPFWREPLEVMADLSVQEVIVMAAAQTGKTESLNNLVAFYIGHDPAPIMVIQPTLELAEGWSKTRLAPMIRDCPQLADKVADSRSRDSNNTMLSKVFLGGSITICGANSPTSLRSRPIRVLLMDEVDAYPADAGGEGDPVGLATRRTDTFHNARIVKTSTPTIKGVSRIESEFDDTDQRRWHVPCPHCKHEFVMAWKDVVWPQDEPENACLQCPKCRKQITDKQRIEAVKAGRWIATAEWTGKVGYHLNGLCSIFPPRPGYKTRLHQAVATFLEAKRAGKERLQEWVNTFLAETFDDDQGEEIQADEIGMRMEARPEYLPVEVLCITAGADVQQDRIECEVVAWNDQWECWGVGFQIFRGDTTLGDVWRKFDDWLMQWQWSREDGPVMRINAVAVDSGYQATTVYRFCEGKLSRRIIPTKGKYGWGSPLLNRGSMTKVPGVKVFTVGVDEAKLKVQAHLKVKEPGPGFCHFYADSGYDIEYFKQLTAEKLVRKYAKGALIKKWVKMRERNEAFDIRVLNLAALDFLQPDWKKLKENLIEKAEKSQDTGISGEQLKIEQTPMAIQLQEEKSAPKRQRMQIRPSWMNGF